VIALLVNRLRIQKKSAHRSLENEHCLYVLCREEQGAQPIKCRSDLRGEEDRKAPGKRNIKGGLGIQCQCYYYLEDFV
jgi:hypothetical protein